MSRKLPLAWCLILFCAAQAYLAASEAPQAGTKHTGQEPQTKWGTETGGVRCSMELAESNFEIPADKSIWIMCRTRKASTEHTEIFSRGLSTYKLKVTDADGKSVPQTRYGTPTPFSPPYRATGTKSQEWDIDRESAVRIHLNRLYDMSRPGKYTLSFSRAIQLENGVSTEVESNSVTVQVTETEVLIPEAGK